MFIRLATDCFYGPTPDSFPFIFGLFKQTIQLLQQINVKKCPSSIWRWDSNPRPFKHESSPITTRPGLTPTSYDCFQSILETTELRANHNNNRGNSESGSPYMFIRMDITFANQVNKALTKEGCLNGRVCFIGASLG